MSHVFPRHSRLHPPIAVSGEGCYLIDRDGKRYLDGSGGAAVSCLGHGDREIIDAVKQQLDQLAFAHTAFMSSQPAESLADLLVAHAPEGLQHVYFVSGGSEANEAAIKLARQYFVEKGEPDRQYLIARRQSYHGNTIGALSASGEGWRRQPFVPLLMDVAHIDPCYAYRLQGEGESDADYGERAASLLEAEILRIGPNRVMAFMAEPVVGATLGAVSAVGAYFRHIRNICDRYGVLLILDEIMCGMGRTGYLFACQHDDVRPDILTIAKGLGGGYQPIGAMLCTAEIYGAISDGSGFFHNGHTYLGHPAATAAGLAVVQALLQRNLVPQVQRQGDKLSARLHETLGQHPYVGDVRGRGLFRGIELVADRETKRPFDPALRIAARIKSTAFAAGLICYPMSGTVDGYHGDHILLAPPFIITDAQIDELVDMLSCAINEVTDTDG